MTGFTNSKGGRARTSPQDLLAPLQVGLGVAQSTMPWLDVAKALVARKAGLPKTGGLIGSTYAQFISEWAALP